MLIPVEISVNAGGARKIYQRGPDLIGDRLQAFGLKAQGFREPLATIGASLIQRIGVEFQTEATSYGPWAPLSEPYGEWKQQHVPGVQTLVGIRPVHKGTRQHPTRPQSYTTSGQMRREVLDPASLTVDSRRMLYAPVSDIAGYHQTGTSRMPARPLIALRPSNLREWDRVFIAWLDKTQKEVEL